MSAVVGDAPLRQSDLSGRVTAGERSCRPRRRSSGSTPTPNAGSKPASQSRRLHRTRRTARTAGSSPVDEDCASQGAALVTHHAIVRATETGARHPACGPHAGGSGGEHIRPQHRAGGQAVPGARISTSASPHDRARFPPLRREGPAPATPLVSNERGDPQLEIGRSRPAGLPTRE